MKEACMASQSGGVDRRAFLRLVAASAMSAAMPGILRAGETNAKRPNILIILADDMGFSDIGCYGGEIATPNLDWLAGNGLRFRQFYNSARCCPTRACLLTGLYPQQAGVGHMVEDKGKPGYRGFLNDSCVTIAEALKPAGYHPLMVGKWHVGSDRPHWPTDRGFERHWGLVSGASNYYKLDKGRVFADDDKSIDPTTEPGFYMTEAFSTRAMKWVDEYAGKADPFLMYLAYTSPHWPLHALPEDIEKYRGKYMMGWDVLREQRRRRMIELGIIDESTKLTPRDERAPEWTSLPQKRKEEMALRMSVYAAQIDRMDQGIGRIIGKLREKDALKDTLILFMADNGGCAEAVNRGEAGAELGTKESFMSYGLPWANASNTPFRLYKHWVHEGGISSPLVAYWEGHTKANTQTAEVSHLIDLMPTCMEAAGAEYPREYKGKAITPMEGKSLVPVLNGQERKGHDHICWEHEGNRAIRQGKWKMVAVNGKKWELYDMSLDRAEMNNVAGGNAGKVEELAGLYEKWATRCGVLPWADVNKKG